MQLPATRIQHSFRNRFVFAFLCLTLFVLNPAELSAQYKTNKHLYNHKDYNQEMGGKYSVSVAGISSLYLPGLGQFYTDETKRGIAFLAAEVGSVLLIPVGFFTWTNYEMWESLNPTRDFIGRAMMLAGLAGLVVVPFWSMIDAIIVARVNNLAWLDSNQTGASFRFNPDLRFLPSRSLAPALTLSVTF